LAVAKWAGFTKNQIYIQTGAPFHKDSCVVLEQLLKYASLATHFSKIPSNPQIMKYSVALIIQNLYKSITKQN